MKTITFSFLFVTGAFTFGTAADNSPPEGFTALFNGKDLAGWKGLVKDPPARARMSPEALAKEQEAADRQMREHWRVEEGALVYDGKGQSLCTARDYGDFELLVDWKIHPGGDSGIYLRGSPQVQIWDRSEGSGGLYNNQRNPSSPIERADRPTGEWNSFRIIMVGERVTVYLNETLVVNDTVLENYWERGSLIYPTGQIELQHHGDALFFKNLYLREIPRPAGAPVLANPLPKKGARVAVTGDSITEQRLYSRFVEDYLLACASELELRVVQLGWSGERAQGFLDRLENDLLPFRPDVVTTCYGMNDGEYRVYEARIGEAYEKAMRAAAAKIKASGALLVVGSPGAVDTFSFKNRVPPKDYNDNLAHLRDIARRISLDNGMAFANVHDAMVRAMGKAKPVLGESYDVCGGDGFHPNQNGHIVMAYAFLKGLGFGGEIGRIQIDLKGSAAASPGHAVVSAAGGRVEIESRRWPFCFSGDEKSPGSTRSIVPFVPFHQELDRFILQVKNLSAPRAKITWGEETKSYSKEELEAGINLAREFLENPFSAPFKKLDEAVARKQKTETTLVKEVITRFRALRELLGDDAEGRAALEKLHQRLLAREEALQDEVRKLVTPVRHTIIVTPES